MKAFSRRVSFCVASLAFGFFAAHPQAQTTPPVQGATIADPAVPVLITPAPTGSGFFVLNQDFSLLQHSTVDSSQNESCSGPGIFSQTNPDQRTLVTDLYDAYISGADAPGYSMAVTAVTPEQLCQMTTPFDYTGGVSPQSLAANDIHHALYYLLSAYGTTDVDTLLVLANLNNASVSSANQFNSATELTLDHDGQYTSLVPDVRSDFGLTAITELKTATSPGNLWIYDPTSNNVYKILGPGGVPLPAVTSFIIPPQIDGGGSLLVLVNQDGLTASNISNPPQDTTPFTIIDLGQLRPLFQTNPAHNTITLPFVQQINATTAFYAMLGAAYNPIDHRVYAVVAGGSSVTDIVESVVSYDTLNPNSPAEKVVADVSNVPFTLDSYPQLALNAASGTLQILTSSPAAVYSVGINGTGNTAIAVPGTTFPDASFQPTYIAANALQGETYIASGSGQVDVLTRPATLQGGLTITLTGSDLGYTSQEYDLTPLALWPVYDASLGTAKLTITATPDGGSPVTVATGHIADIGYPGSSFYTYTFPAPGRYTFVATAEASALYPAVTSPPLYVYVGNTGVYPTTVTLTAPATAPSTNGEASFNATVVLSGTTYAPTGQVYIQDQTGAEVANISLPKGVISNPLTLPVTIGDGVSTLTAVYSGDEQNQASTSAPQSITVGTVAKVTPTFTVTIPGAAVAGAMVSGNLKFASTSTTAPTGNVGIYAAASGSSTANQIATVSAAQAFASSGTGFTFTAPAAGSYTVFAGYGGDASYNNATSASVAFKVSAAPTQTTVIGIVAPATATPGVAFNTVIGFNVEGAFTTQPTGNIVVTATLAGGAPIAIATVTPAEGMAPGGANVSVNLPNAGVYTLNANYAGDALYSASSNTASIAVKGFSTSIAVSAGATQKSGAAFNATIALTSTASTTLLPTGNVVVTQSFASGTPTTITTLTAAQAFASGGVAVPLKLSTVGNYTLTAAYSGGGAFLASTGSAAITVISSLDSTSLDISTPSNVTAATPFNVNIAIVPKTASTASPTGNVVITGTLGSATSTYATIPAAQTFAAGGVGAPVTLPSAGTYILTATYAGDANYGASTGSVGVVVAAPVLPPPTFQLIGRPLGVVSTPIPFTVNIYNAKGNANAPVSITSTLNGAPGPSATVTGPMSNFTLTFPQTGTYTVTGTYPGDSMNGPVTADPIQVVIYTQAAYPGFTLQGSNTTLNLDTKPFEIPPSINVVVPMNIKTLNGFTGLVQMDVTAKLSGQFALGEATEQPDIRFVDANGNPLGVGLTSADVFVNSSVTNIGVLIKGSQGQSGSNRPAPGPRSPRLPLLCLLLGGVPLGILKRRKRFARILGWVCFGILLYSAGGWSSGCSLQGEAFNVTVTATNSETGITQTVTFPIHYAQ